MLETKTVTNGHPAYNYKVLKMENSSLYFTPGFGGRGSACSR